MVVLDSKTAQLFDRVMGEFEDDIHREWDRDEYDCWRVNRPAGWADSTAVEALELIAHGAGTLDENGIGGPTAGEVIISLGSPYQFRTPADDRIDVGHLLVVTGLANNREPETGTRLFRVDAVKRRSVRRRRMTIYLTELFSTPVPGAL